MTFVRIVLLLVKFGLRHQENIFPILRSLKFIGKSVRTSAAALLLLEREDKYVLIRNHHRPEYIGPIGGVFKHSHQTPKELERIDWEPHYTSQDHKLHDMRHDLRGFIQGKDLASFLNWLNSRQDREGEQALFREFDEELGEGRVGRAWRNKIAKTRVSLVRTILEGPFPVTGQKYTAQFRYFEIFKIDPHCKVGDVLAKELLRRVERGDNNLRLVDKEEIAEGRTRDDGTLITGSANYFFSKRWHGREPQSY